jgi:quercetin dioxygenase-like cupin family protein
MWKNNGPDVGYFWPRYNYSITDVLYEPQLALAGPSVCKWDVSLRGLNADMGVLYLPPCTYIAPHWHPDTYELNFVLQGELDYTMYPYGKNAVPINGTVTAGNIAISPMGITHLLVNSQCVGTAMVHMFPTSINEDFMSLWSTAQRMPKDYLSDVFPEGSQGAKDIDQLRMDDHRLHTRQQMCMQRCGITQDFYAKFTCPKKLPFLDTMLDMPENGALVDVGHDLLDKKPKGFLSKKPEQSAESVVEVKLESVTESTTRTTSYNGSYYSPIYNYTDQDINHEFKTQLAKPYVCKWGAKFDGLGSSMSVLYLPPCTHITPHWHSDTYELNLVLQGQLTFSIFPWDKNVTLKGTVPTGSMAMSPLGVTHLLSNQECVGLAMTHVFPSSLDADFFSMWGNVKQMPHEYLKNAFPAGSSGAEDILKVRIPDTIHTLSQKCMKKCGITQEFYNKFTCPTKIPFKGTVLQMPENGGQVVITTTTTTTPFSPASQPPSSTQTPTTLPHSGECVGNDSRCKGTTQVTCQALEEEGSDCRWQDVLV